MPATAGAAALKYVGVGYGWLDYGAITLHELHIDVPGLRSFIESMHTMICSQLVDRAALDAGKHLFDDGGWPGYIKPSDLGQLLSSNSELQG
jgi:hypothetical protein